MRRLTTMKLLIKQHGNQWFVFNKETMDLVCWVGFKLIENLYEWIGCHYPKATIEVELKQNAV